MILPDETCKMTFLNDNHRFFISKMTLGVMTTSRFKLSRTTYAIITLGSIKLGFTTHSRMNALTNRMTQQNDTQQSNTKKMTFSRIAFGFMTFIRITLNIATLSSITLGRKIPGAAFTTLHFLCNLRIRPIC
jgi:hypothetical protein